MSVKPTNPGLGTSPEELLDNLYSAWQEEIEQGNRD